MDAAEQGAKRKRAPPTKGPCRARGEVPLELQGVQRLSARSLAPSLQGVRWVTNLRARSCALSCKECGGGAICEHGRQRSQCKECGGGSICEHGRIRYSCKECGAVKAEAEAELLGDVDAAEQGVKRKRGPYTKVPCPHGVKYRSACKVCSACPHGRRRSHARSAVVINLRARSSALMVQGVRWGTNLRARSSAHYMQGVRWVTICEHGRQRSQCKECGGSQICEHGRQRHRCKECRAVKAEAS